jgi:hypothetical protein
MKHFSFAVAAISLALVVSGCQMSESEKTEEIENAVMQNDEFGFAFVTTPECVSSFEVSLWGETTTSAGKRYVSYEVTQVCDRTFSDGGIFVTTTADAEGWYAGENRQMFFVGQGYAVLYYPSTCASSCKLKAVVY